MGDEIKPQTRVIVEPFDVSGGTEALNKWTHSVVERIRQLDARDDLNDPNERKNLEDAVKKFQEEMVAMREAVKNSARNVPGGDPAAGGMGHLNLRGDPPKGMSRLHFNLIGSKPDDLCYAAQFGRTAYPGMAKEGERWARKYGMSDEWRSRMYELQALNDLMLVSDIAMVGRGDTQYAGISESRTMRLQSTRLWKDWKALTEEFKRAGALDTLAAAEGGDWVPTILSSQLIDLIQAELVVAPLFPRTSMPSPNYDLPIMGADAVAYKIGENTSDTGQTAITSSVFVTNKVTLAAVKLATRVIASSEVTEDTAVGMVPIILSQIAKSIARATDDAIINGDSDGTHQDADVDALGATDRRTAWNGLRKLGLAGAAAVDAANGQLTTAGVLSVKGLMGSLGARPGQGVWITGFKSLIELMQTKDGLGNEIFLTLDKFGPNFVGITGQLGSVFGSPVVLSEFQREDVNASGVQDGVTTDRGSILYANRESFTLGERRTVTLARSSERYIEFDQVVFVGTWRGDFKPYFPSEVGVGVLYNTR